ncbi:MAG: DUF3368 domain-containing protein [Ignavibacteriae bacterium]|nr:DUF3368 domain-containing protein [Ignavibacteriota bacterium]
MIVVSDTTPISSLFRIHHLHLLHALFENVVIPSAVMEELLQLRRWGYDLREISSSSWIEVKSVSDNEYLYQLKLILDDGEAEAIALAKELHAELLLTDEMKGRTVAKREGLQIVGTLGILLRSKQVGLLSDVRQPLDFLIREANFRISDSLYQEILNKAEE